jgi:hypothetical protein
MSCLVRGKEYDGPINVGWTNYGNAPPIRFGSLCAHLDGHTTNRLLEVRALRVEEVQNFGYHRMH